MAPFYFRLAKVLDWYREQSQIEEQKLRVCSERAAQAKTEIERHQRDVLARQMELIRSPRPEVAELVALGPFRRRANQLGIVLIQKYRKAEQEFTTQRGIAQQAQRRLRLVENLRDRKSSEHKYEMERELEELASETHLAGIVRALNSKYTA